MSGSYFLEDPKTYYIRTLAIILLSDLFCLGSFILRNGLKSFSLGGLSRGSGVSVKGADGLAGIAVCTLKPYSLAITGVRALGVVCHMSPSGCSVPAVIIPVINYRFCKYSAVLRSRSLRFVDLTEFSCFWCLSGFSARQCFHNPPIIMRPCMCV